MVNVVSIDLEDWYHICGIDNKQWANEWEKYRTSLENNVGKILLLLTKYKITATFFVVGYIAEKNPALIKKIADKGHEIASHGYYHRRIFDMTPEEFEDDLLKSKKIIEDITGKKVLGYRAPEWSLKKETKWALDILKKNGFEYDSSANPIKDLSGKEFGVKPGQIETEFGKIWEFPASTFRMFKERIPFSGGLPLRIVPYCFVVRFFKSFNKKGIPVMLYIHPWEFDEEHIKIDLPLNRKFMHYFNCKTTPTKTEALFKHFDFTAAANVLEIGDYAAENALPERKSGVHKEFVISAMSTITGFLIIYIVLFTLPGVINFYALLIPVIGLTILYWPWTVIMKCIEKIIRK